MRHTSYVVATQRCQRKEAWRVMLIAIALSPYRRQTSYVSRGADARRRRQQERARLFFALFAMSLSTRIPFSVRHAIFPSFRRAYAGDSEGQRRHRRGHARR